MVVHEFRDGVGQVMGIATHGFKKGDVLLQKQQYSLDRVLFHVEHGRIKRTP